jgi:phage terminase large subunit-like protein
VVTIPALARHPAEFSPFERLAMMPAQERRAWIEAQPDATIAAIKRGDWLFHARPKQRQPDGDWLLWLIRSGRGWGKNMTSSNTLADWLEQVPFDRHGNPTVWMVVAHKLADVESANFGGQSGLLDILRHRGYKPMDRRPRVARASREKAYHYVTSPKPIITLYPHGQIIYGDSIESGGEDVGRNKNLAGVWLDEVAKWGVVAHKAWYEGLLPALRADLPAPFQPRCIVSTTPKGQSKLLRDWTERSETDPKYRLTVGSTYENSSNLAPHMLAEFIREYEGTRTGRQEIHGELLDEVEGALWTRDMIDATRVTTHPELIRVAVGMDPAGTGEAAEMGLVVVGQDAAFHQYVLADHSCKMAGRAAAERAWRLVAEYRHLLPRPHWPTLVVEEDYGKKWLKDTLEDVYEELKKEGLFDPYDPMPLAYQKASLLGAKDVRAEPVVMRYETMRFHHVGVFKELERQQCTWDRKDPKAKSPDRVDGLVHAGLWLREQEPYASTMSSWADNMSMPIGQLEVFG